MSLDITTYTYLNPYNVLATGTIITNLTGDATISGVYGYASQTGTGTIIGTQDAGNAIVALNPQLEYFVNDINAYRATLNGKMVLAKHLVNGKTIYQDNDCDSVEYYHLECENHSAIFANGILAESYLDVNNRDVFDNSITIRRNNVLKKYIN